ncbi:TPA: indole-3-glycerol phosphate synthase TrpC [Candidatus Poribacteria bacterium]|nr:indole-3-glycerol phosphate synthase TrpC [Candidatus Poribacteria bacterium]
MKKTILDEIIAYKKIELEEQKKLIPLDEIKQQIKGIDDIRSFKSAISGFDKVNLIAEIKKASPSRGVIREDFNPSAIAEIYEQNGVSAISVLTDKKFFQGDLSFLKIVRSVTSKTPILRKDFIIDEYQIFQSRLFGADAILLIANVLDLQKLNMLISIARGIGLDCLVEVHNENDLNKAIASDAEIIGINNRDLNTFTVDLKTTADLVRLIPDDKIVVSESGISSSKDVEFLKKLRVNAMLVGESLMASKDIAKKIKQLTTNQEEHDERNKSFSK